MGGFAPPIPQKDSDWEIRVAVLLSLLFQILLIFGGPFRKRSSHPLISFGVWSIYLLADWVADLALGLLLNNLGNIGGNATSSISTIAHASGLKRGPASAASNSGDTSSSPIIFVFWTPFLLLHLGGPDTITAYSLEDNQLWGRHLIGLLFELFSAFVIFGCSIRSNPMVPATALMFVVGIIKYAERTCSLYCGSVDGFRENILEKPDPGPNYAKLMTEFDAKEKAGLVVEIAIADDEAMKKKDELEVGETVQLVKKSTSSVEEKAYDFFLIFRRLFVNLILSYKERKISQAFFLDRDDITPTKAFQVVEVELNFIYEMVYTKAPVAHTKVGCALRFVGSACIVSSLLIFFFHHKRDFARVDVAITYALLLGGLFLDATALVMLLFSHRMLVYLEKDRRVAWLARAIKSVPWPQLRRWSRRWSERTSQLNLVSYSLDKPDPHGGCCRCFFSTPRVVLVKVADALRLRELPLVGPLVRSVLDVLDDLFFIRRESLCFREGEDLLLLKFVFDGLKDKAMKAKNMMFEEMAELCRYRGEGVLVHDKAFRGELVKMLTSQVVADEGKKKQEDEEEDKEVIKRLLEEKLKVLDDSVKKDFDESLLLWHIATDLCIHPPAERTAENKYTPIGKTLSEYMLYLLIKQPEMLTTTAGIGLLRYRDTCAEAKRFFESAVEFDPGHDDARKMLLNVNTSKKPSEVKGDRSKSVLFDAVILAKVLRELGGDLMWEVVARVWVEMLIYAAGKCRGSTHVRQLSHGGELITIVWFLMAHMGLGDMYQIHEGDASAKLIVHDQ